MQYYLCPRCKFSVPAKKNRCSTCGFDILSLKQAESNGDNKVAKTSIWDRLFASNKQKETAATEKPALS